MSGEVEVDLKVWRLHVAVVLAVLSAAFMFGCSAGAEGPDAVLLTVEGRSDDGMPLAELVLVPLDGSPAQRLAAVASTERDGRARIAAAVSDDGRRVLYQTSVIDGPGRLATGLHLRDLETDEDRSLDDVPTPGLAWHSDQAVFMRWDRASAEQALVTLTLAPLDDEWETLEGEDRPCEVPGVPRMLGVSANDVYVAVMPWGKRSIAGLYRRSLETGRFDLLRDMTGTAKGHWSLLETPGLVSNGLVALRWTAATTWKPEGRPATTTVDVMSLPSLRVVHSFPVPLPGGVHRPSAPVVDPDGDRVALTVWRGPSRRSPGGYEVDEVSADGRTRRLFKTGGTEMRRPGTYVLGYVGGTGDLVYRSVLRPKPNVSGTVRDGNAVLLWDRETKRSVRLGLGLGSDARAAFVGVAKLP